MKRNPFEFPKNFLYFYYILCHHIKVYYFIKSKTREFQPLHEEATKLSIFLFKQCFVTTLLHVLCTSSIIDKFQRVKDNGRKLFSAVPRLMLFNRSQTTFISSLLHAFKFSNNHFGKWTTTWDWIQFKFLGCEFASQNNFHLTTICMHELRIYSFLTLFTIRYTYLLINKW